jgi:hypothetical protein
MPTLIFLDHYPKLKIRTDRMDYLSPNHGYG